MKITTLTTYDGENNQEAFILRRLIAKRRKVLIKAMQKLERLKQILFTIEQAYENRVGLLQRRGMFIEFEILRIKRIQDLMRVGLTYKEALVELEEIDNVKRGWEFERSQAIDHDNQHISTGPTDYQAIIEDVKGLWKKLVRQFHPDLTADKTEKKNREEMMKKINNAFAANDLQTLKAIDANMLLEENVTFATNLEKKLEAIENAIITIEDEDMSLKKTHWYSWHRAGVKKREQLLYELETAAQHELTQKEKLLNELKKSLPQQ